MLEDLAIPAPAAEGQVTRTHEHVAFVLRGQDRDLGVKNAVRDGDWLNFVILADALRTLFAQTATHALHVSEYESLRSPSPDKRVGV